MGDAMKNPTTPAYKAKTPQFATGRAPSRIVRRHPEWENCAA